jgi:hypothetical protein
MTLNALTNGCNQKSNRAPQMSLAVDEVQTALDELREMGAVAEVQAGGRVPKYRHYMYDWLGVDKLELAVVAELLLRGPQTAGALRGHAARMDPIPDLATLRQVLDRLVEKQLIVALSPAGRGQVFAHCLYRERELDELRKQYASGEVPSARPAASPSVSADDFSRLQAEVAELRAEVERLKGKVEPAS